MAVLVFWYKRTAFSCRNCFCRAIAMTLADLPAMHFLECTLVLSPLAPSAAPGQVPFQTPSQKALHLIN